MKLLYGSESRGMRKWKKNYGHTETKMSCFVKAYTKLVEIPKEQIREEFGTSFQ